MLQIRLSPRLESFSLVHLRGSGVVLHSRWSSSDTNATQRAAPINKNVLLAGQFAYHRTCPSSACRDLDNLIFHDVAFEFSVRDSTTYISITSDVTEDDRPFFETDVANLSWDWSMLIVLWGELVLANHESATSCTPPTPK